MSLWSWIRSLFTTPATEARVAARSEPEQASPPSSSPPPKDDLLTGEVESVGESVVVLLDSGRIVHCPSPDTSAFHRGQRVAIERIEIEDRTSIGVGLRVSDSRLEMRHIPELDNPPRRPEPKPLTPEEKPNGNGPTRSAESKRVSSLPSADARGSTIARRTEIRRCVRRVKTCQNRCWTASPPLDVRAFASSRFQTTTRGRPAASEAALQCT